jgi:hypothetical protein
MGDKFLFKLNRRAETTGVKGAKNDKRKKKLPFFRNDNEKGSITNYPKGYHISNNSQYFSILISNNFFFLSL